MDLDIRDVYIDSHELRSRSLIGAQYWEDVVSVTQSCRITVIVQSDSSVYIFDDDGALLTASHTEDSTPVSAVSLAADDTYIAVATEGGSIRVMETWKGELVWKKRFDKAESFRDISVDNQGGLLLVSSDEEMGVSLVSRGWFGFSRSLWRKGYVLKARKLGEMVVSLGEAGLVLETKNTLLCVLSKPEGNWNYLLDSSISLEWIEGSVYASWGESVYIIDGGEGFASKTFKVPGAEIYGVCPFHDCILLYVKSNSGMSILITTSYGDIVNRKPLEMSVRDSSWGYHRGIVASVPLKKACQTSWILGAGTQLVNVKLQTTDDRVKEMTNAFKFNEALEFAWRMQNQLEDTSITEVGARVIRVLIKSHNNAFALDICSKYARRDRKCWEAFVKVFVQEHQTRDIIDSIPFERPRLRKKSYDSVLQDLLQHDEEGFVLALRSFPSRSYNTSKILQEVEEKPETELLNDAQVILHLALRNYESVTERYDSKRSRVFANAGLPVPQSSRSQTTKASNNN